MKKWKEKEEMGKMRKKKVCRIKKEKREPKTKWRECLKFRKLKEKQKC